MSITNEEEFLEQRNFNEHKRDLTLSNINKKLNYMLGTTFTRPAHALSTSKKSYNEDYSELDLQNKGAVFKKSTILGALYAGGSFKTGIWGLENEALVDLSKDNLLKELTVFNEGIENKTSIFYQQYTELTTYISENILTNPSISSNFLKFSTYVSENIFSNPEMASNFITYTLQASTIALGLYAANEVKKRKSVDAFINSIDDNSEKDFRVSTASSIFQDVDNFYKFRRLNVVIGDKITDYLKKVADVAADAFYNNVSHPVLEISKNLLGQNKYDAMKNFMENKIIQPVSEPISDFLKRKPTSSNDLIRMMEEKYDNSQLNEFITNSSELNVAKEVSKLAEDVYFDIQKIQIKKLITESLETIKSSQEKIDSFSSNNLTFLQKRAIKKENKKINKSMEVLKEIEFLSKKDEKKNALSKYTVLSEVAHDFLNQIDSQGILSFNATNLHDFVDNSIKNKQNDIQSTYLSLNNTKYIPFIEKMIVPEDTSIKDLFNSKIDDFIQNKEEELLNKKIAAKSKLSSNIT